MRAVLSLGRSIFPMWCGRISRLGGAAPEGSMRRKGSGMNDRIGSLEIAGREDMAGC